jgi:sugar lactone lactonase YvrE
VAATREHQVDVLSEGHTFLECPRWHDGHLYASDFFTSRVLRWAGGDGPETVCEVDGMPAGLGWAGDGTPLIVSMLNRKLLRLRDGALEEVADLFDQADWHCNDMVVDDAGGAYVGNFGWDEGSDPTIRATSLLRVAPGGAVTVVADDLVCPNGMAITDDGTTLLVNETFAARVTAFDRASDGTLSNRRVWASFLDDPPPLLPDLLAADVVLPDGMALDAEGALWLGDCRGSGAARVAEGGEVLDFVSTGDHATFAVALGGDDGRTLYLCTNIPYGKGDWTKEHKAAMRSCRVDVPRAGRP